MNAIVVKCCPGENVVAEDSGWLPRPIGPLDDRQSQRTVCVAVVVERDDQGAEFADGPGSIVTGRLIEVEKASRLFAVGDSQ